MNKKTRVLLKISWEALQWEREYGIDPQFIEKLAWEIKEIHDQNIELALVLGWWNIFRWLAGAANWMNRVTADYMWMLATAMNAIAFRDALHKVGCISHIFSALDIPEIWDKYIQRKAMNKIAKWSIVICTAGTGNPYFTTDSWWVLRALELNCDMMIKATKVDGVYDKDPKKYDDAVMIEHASYKDVIHKDIQVMDHTGITLAKDGNMPLKVVNLYKKWAILRAIKWEKEWTTIS
jgi:uridylate kinase